MEQVCVATGTERSDLRKEKGQSASAVLNKETLIAEIPEVAKVDVKALSEVRARRTAFVARFIVLREGKRTKAHRVIEMMTWEDSVTAEELAARFRGVFQQNGDKLGPVDRDIRRALAHSSRSLNHFIQQYSSRATLSFLEALIDYERSNKLLFGGDEEDGPKPGGWRLPHEIRKSEKATPRK